MILIFNKNQQNGNPNYKTYKNYKIITKINSVNCRIQNNIVFLAQPCQTCIYINNIVLKTTS